MNSLGYYNGVIKPLNELFIPVLDRAFYFGDGVYEVAYAIGQKPFALKEHINRFIQSCKLLKINFSQTEYELERIIQQLLNKEGSYKQKIYWQVSRYTGIRTHDFEETRNKSNLFIAITNEEVQNMETRKFNLISLDDMRYLYCNVKTLNLIPAVLASQKAKIAGADEAVLIRNGFITECAHSNISILKGGVLQTAPANNFILAGITRQHLIEICDDLNIPVVFQPFTLQQLLDCDEAIVSASGSLFMAAASLNGVKIGGKNPNLLHQLQIAYKNKIITSCGKLLY